MKIFITGSCGFIGGHLCEKLLTNKQNTIIGIDNLNSVIYDNSEKKKTLLLLLKNKNYIHIDDSIENDNYILKYNPDIIIHLAAYANVQKSRSNPVSYVSNNVGNTCKLLDEITSLPGFMVSALLILTVLFAPSGPGHLLHHKKHLKH